MKTANPTEEDPFWTDFTDDFFERTTQEIEESQVARQEGATLPFGNLGVVAHKYFLPPDLNETVGFLAPAKAKTFELLFMTMQAGRRASARVIACEYFCLREN